MDIILFDDPKVRQNLLPLTYTRPVGAIRVGILTLAEKWERFAGVKVSWLTEPYLRSMFPLSRKRDEEGLYLNGSLVYDEAVWERSSALLKGQGLRKDGYVIAFRESSNEENLDELTKQVEWMEYEGEIVKIERAWHIFQLNAKVLKADFLRLTAGRKSQPIEDKHTVVYAPENVFLEEGASVKAAIIDAENGPVYLGKDSVVHPGSIIRGSLALCEGAQIGMGAKMRGDSTIGPFSKVGGEVSNSVVLGYSNKAHDGFMGNSVMGEWCNIGADTNSSNMKNNYANIRLWNYDSGRFEDTGTAFCGFVMGDHSKLGINVMLNSGTSIGVACNLYESGYFRNFIPSFSQGTPEKLGLHRLNEAIETARIATSRRNISFGSSDESIFGAIFELSSRYRKTP